MDFGPFNISSFHPRGTDETFLKFQQATQENKVCTKHSVVTANISELPYEKNDVGWSTIICISTFHFIINLPRKN